MDIIQQVQKRMLISLSQVAKSLNLHEGDHVLIEEMDGGIFIKPVSWHEKNQEYFWTEEWQEKLKRSQNDLENGRFKQFGSAKELLSDLGEDDANNHID